MSDRGMKKWAPYKSLPEHDPAILTMEKNRDKIQKPLISEDVAEQINRILCNYNHENLEVKYYENGYVKIIESKIKKIDVINRFILLENDTKIKFSNLLNLENI